MLIISRLNINSICALEILTYQSTNLSLLVRLNLNLCNKVGLDDLILGRISGELLGGLSISYPHWWQIFFW